jgi:hypothetical protein
MKAPAIGDAGFIDSHGHKLVLARGDECGLF